MLIHCHRGLGDSIYSRAFVKNLPKPSYLDTPWPSLYSDIPGVHCVRPSTVLRTQAKNIARYDQWEVPPRGLPQRFPRYGAEGIIPGLTQTFAVRPGEFDMPPLPESPEQGKYVVVRPVTVRSEWRADTRNPDPNYIAIAAAFAKQRGYRVISIADLQEGQEWTVGNLPYADVRYHKGELQVEKLLALVANAAAVIGGIGWIVPACLAAKVPAWIVCGGQGGYNAPELICPPDSTITFAVPDNFCRCRLKQHDCDKGISNYGPKLAEWAAGHLPVVAREKNGLA
jgi:hypothetical protein